MKIRSPLVLRSIVGITFVVVSSICQALTKPDYPVIFIHGITGTAENTWGDFKSFLVAEGWQFGGSPTYSPDRRIEHSLPRAVLPWGEARVR